MKKQEKNANVKAKTGPQVRSSEWANLSSCVVDSDSETIKRARRLRSKAVAVSVMVQVLCVAAMLIVPLIAAPRALPPVYVVTPVPPYRGSPEPQRLHRAAAHATPSLFARPIFLAPAAHFVMREPSSASAPVAIGTTTDFGNSDNQPGFGIPGSTGTGLPVEPRPAPPVQTVIHRSEGVMAGALLYRIDPRYPELARELHLSGTVRLQATIGRDGRVRDLETLSGNPILAGAAVEAVRQWRYRPTLLNGEPVEVETYITVRFVLSE